jgi:hypothetical protein
MSPAEVISAVRSVSAAEVQNTAEELFAGRGWRLAAVGPGPDSESALASISNGVEG